MIRFAKGVHGARGAPWRVALFSLVAIAGALLPSAASAQENDEVLTSRHKSYESPQHFAIELHLGPYYPRVDTDPSIAQSGSNAAPYARSFGTSARFLVSGEFDFQAYRIPSVGTIGPGVSFGYTSASGLAPLKTCENGTCTSAESTSLTIYPMYLVAVLRVDILDRLYKVPFVPYVKGGLGYALWVASDSGGTSQFTNPTTGKTTAGEGSTWGTQLAAGIMLDLGFIDRRTAIGLDNATGINHTYAFFEGMRYDLPGIFQAHALYVGDYTWTAGLAFEF